MAERKESVQNYDIRLLRESDVPAVAAVYARAFNALELGEEWSQEAAEGLMGYWYKHQPDLFFAAFDESGNVLGAIVFGIKPWWNGPHLTDGELFVDPDHQGRGVAKSLLRKEIQEAVRLHEIVEIEAIADREHAFPIGWYDRIGIRQTGLAHIAGDPQEVLRNLT